MVTLLYAFKASSNSKLPYSVGLRQFLSCIFLGIFIYTW